jgi:F-type H+-transporting ATPase subunit c
MIIKNKRVYLYGLVTIFTSIMPIIANTNTSSHSTYNYGLFAVAGAFSISLTSCVGAIAQSITARVALEGTARNPEASGKLFVPMILALALIESLVLFTLLIAFSVVSKIA